MFVLKGNNLLSLMLCCIHCLLLGRFEATPVSFRFSLFSNGELRLPVVGPFVGCQLKC